MRLRPSRLMLLLALVLALGAARPAEAFAYGSIGDSTCRPSDAFGSVQCFYGSVQVYDATQFKNLTLTISDYTSNYWVRNSIRAYSGSPCTKFVELGLTHGYASQDWYGVFYNQYIPGTGYWSAWKGAKSVDSSTHTYHLTYQGSNTYTAQYDSDSANAETHSGFGGGTCNAMAGLTSNIAPDWSPTSTSTFDETPLAWTDTSFNYHSQWDTGHYYVDYPCGQQGNSTPYCFNGAQYGSSHWAANNP